mmetsp:Transcript_51567/g.138381  ORF Transcript_51567/g.138381 Transcript_51567/m.138381 type:complete len:255 (-) Transcript_51567:287-1051(-)
MSMMHNPLSKSAVMLKSEVVTPGHPWENVPCNARNLECSTDRINQPLSSLRCRCLQFRLNAPRSSKRVPDGGTLRRSTSAPHLCSSWQETPTSPHSRLLRPQARRKCHRCSCPRERPRSSATSPRLAHGLRKQQRSEVCRHQNLSHRKVCSTSWHRTRRLPHGHLQRQSAKLRIHGHPSHRSQHLAASTPGGPRRSLPPQPRACCLRPWRPAPPGRQLRLRRADHPRANHLPMKNKWPRSASAWQHLGSSRPSM